MIPTLRVLLLSFLLPFVAGAQKAYTKTDRKAIGQMRQSGQAAMNRHDHNALYRVGLFFEGIYERYKDTSIRAAIRYYTASFQTEGDLRTGDPAKAARRLGKIYEMGKGVVQNLQQAYIAYFMAGPTGAADARRVKALVCPADFVQPGKAGETNKLEIAYFPGCRLKRKETFATLARYATELRQHPDVTVSVKANWPESELTHFFNYFTRSQRPSEWSNLVVSYLVEQEGISADRFVFEEATTDSLKGYVISLQTTSETTLEKVYPKRVGNQLKGTYAYTSGLCSVNYWFNPNGEVQLEQGCEGSSTIGVGRYVVRNDVVELMPEVRPLRYELIHVRPGANGRTVLLFTDSSGAPLSRFYFRLASRFGKDSSDIDYQRIEADSNGRAELLPQNLDSICLQPMPEEWTMRNTSFQCRIESLSDFVGKEVEVRYNYPAHLLTYPFIQLIPRLSLKLRIHPDGRFTEE